jgi:hypothetical protein
LTPKKHSSSIVHLNSDGLSVDELSIEKIEGRFSLGAGLELDQTPTLDHTTLHGNLRKRNLKLKFYLNKKTKQNKNISKFNLLILKKVLSTRRFDFE